MTETSLSGSAATRWSGRLIGPASILVFFWALAAPRAYDLWYYMRMGREILERGEIPHDVNFLALPNQIPRGYDINPEWGFGVLTQLVYSLAGSAGLAVLLALLITAIFTVVYAACRSTSMHPLWCLVWSFGGLWMIRGRFLLRTQLVTILCLGILVLVLLKAKNKRQYGLPWTILPFFVVWANLHPGVLSGVILLGAWTAGEFFHQVVLKHKTPVAWTTLLGATLLAFGATFIRPGGYLVYQFTYDLMSQRTLAKSLVVEMTPLTSDWWQSALGVFIGVVLLSFSLALLSGTARMSHALVTIAFIFLMFRHNRAVGELYTTVGPLVAASLMAAWPVLSDKYLGPVRRWWPRVETPLTALSALALAALLTVRLSTPRLFDLSLPTDWYPVYSTRFLQEHPVKGVLFNSYEFGGFLSYFDRKPYIHGMTGVYGDDLLQKHLDILASSKKRAELIAQDNITAFVLHYPTEVDSHRDLLTYLQDDPNWSLVFWDDASVVYQKRLTQTTEFRAVNPVLDDPFPTGDLVTARQELEGFVQSYPQVNKAWLLLAELNRRQQNYPAALTQLDTVLERRPDWYEPLLKRSSIRFNSGDTEGAVNDLTRAIRLAPDSPVAHFNLALALSKQANSISDEDPAKASKIAHRAREQAARALELQADFPGAQALYEALSGY